MAVAAEALPDERPVDEAAATMVAGVERPENVAAAGAVAAEAVRDGRSKNVAAAATVGYERPQNVVAAAAAVAVVVVVAGYLCANLCSWKKAQGWPCVKNPHFDVLKHVV